MENRFFRPFGPADTVMPRNYSGARRGAALFVLARGVIGDADDALRCPYFPWSLAYDGTDFFETVACDACDGTLLRIPGSGDPPVRLGDGTFAAVDEACAYWSTTQGIFSVEKSYGGG